MLNIITIANGLIQRTRVSFHVMLMVLILKQSLGRIETMANIVYHHKRVSIDLKLHTAQWRSFSKSDLPMAVWF